jgi:hypothetical protein
MSIKFVGPHQTLQDRLLLLGLDGEWREQPNKVWRFVCVDGAGLNWSETKGTVWFDGSPTAKAILRAKVGALLVDEAHGDDVTIFVVRGCDKNVREQLELRCRQLGYEPDVVTIYGSPVIILRRLGDR